MCSAVCCDTRVPDACRLYTPKSIGCYAVVMCFPHDHRTVNHRGGQPGDLDYFLDAMHRDFNDIGLSMPHDHGVVHYTKDLGSYPQPHELDDEIKKMLKQVYNKHQRVPDVVFFVMLRKGACRVVLSTELLTWLLK